MPRARARKPPQLTAATADKHHLYQRSVQDAPSEAKFVADTFRKLRGRPAITLREDFCGTALFASEWVRAGVRLGRSATGLDIDAAVLRWGREHNVAPLGALAERVTLLQQDVRHPTGLRFDVIAAFNFSYWVFDTRAALRAYFASVREALAEDGVLFLDAYGGWESHQPMEERRAIADGFTYVWDQAVVDPIRGRVLNHIHFEFKDGTSLRNAFTYDWRFWTLPELQEVLAEAGFSTVRTYWDVAGEDEDSRYRPKTRAENQPGWLAYLTACR